MSQKPKGGFIPWDYGDNPPVVYLSPARVPLLDKNEFFECHIEALRAAWDIGCFPPGQLLVEAIRLCEEHGRPQPGWLCDALTDDLRTSRADPDKPGRHARKPRRERDLHAHFVRWAYACTALKRRDLLPDFGFKPTRQGAWELVSEQLRGTPAQGSWGAVQRSHRRVTQMIKSGLQKSG